jgi:hypothetical protein
MHRSKKIGAARLGKFFDETVAVGDVSGKQSLHVG